MKQYEYEATHRTRGNVERIRATARNAAIARAHIVEEYGQQFDIADLFCNIDKPHAVLGEIDCTAPGCEEFAMQNRRALARIYKAHKTAPKPYSLTLCAHPCTHEGPTSYHQTMAEAKAAAKAANAKPWNY